MFLLSSADVGFSFLVSGISLNCSLAFFGQQTIGSKPMNLQISR